MEMSLNLKVQRKQGIRKMKIFLSSTLLTVIHQRNANKTEKREKKDKAITRERKYAENEFEFLFM